jgi:hypothetical protein
MIETRLFVAGEQATVHGKLLCPRRRVRFQRERDGQLNTHDQETYHDNSHTGIDLPRRGDSRKTENGIEGHQGDQYPTNGPKDKPQSASPNLLGELLRVPDLVRFRPGGVDEPVDGR